VPNVPPMLPDGIRSIHVQRAQFITPQHFEAWLVGMPLRRHLTHRKKLTRDIKDAFFRHHPYKCSFCPSTSLLTVDHIVPQILGGSSVDANFRPACLPCNVAQWKPFARYLREYDAWLAEVAA
jgi:5-methylcytosine-specific restriction endonuclease McrA